MGSRIVLLSGLYMIIGMYAVGIKNADSKQGKVAWANVERVQAEELAKTGTQVAINRMGISKPNKTISGKDVPMLGGRITYVADDTGLDEDLVKITSTGTFGSAEVTKISLVRLSSTSMEKGKGKKKRWNRWVTEKVYTTSSTQFNAWN